MEGFEFFAPTKVVFGKGVENGVGQAVKQLGGTRVLIVCYGDPNNVAEKGVLERVGASLHGEGIAYAVFEGVVPNPVLSHVKKGMQKASSFGADFFLAVGGGSAIDTAKAIAVGAANPGEEIWDFFVGKCPLQKTLPVGVVLTIAASGSEMSNVAIITNDDTHDKRGITSDLIRPRISIMNPELTYTLPKKQISNGIADIMMHTMDRYFTSRLDNDLTDAIAEAVLRTMVKYGPIMLNDPTNYQAASEIMWCGTVSHNGITGLGGINDFSPHILAAPLSGLFNAAHGPTLTAIWGHWAKYVIDVNPARFAKFGQQVFADSKVYSSAREAASSAIETTVAFFKRIEMPTNFSELGIEKLSEDQLRQLQEFCLRGNTTIGNFKSLGKEDIYNIYCMANQSLA